MKKKKVFRIKLMISLIIIISPHLKNLKSSHNKCKTSILFLGFKMYKKKIFQCLLAKSQPETLKELIKNFRV